VAQFPYLGDPVSGYVNLFTPGYYNLKYQEIVQGSGLPAVKTAQGGGIVTASVCPEMPEFWCDEQKAFDWESHILQSKCSRRNESLKSYPRNKRNNKSGSYVNSQRSVPRTEWGEWTTTRGGKTLVKRLFHCWSVPETQGTGPAVFLSRRRRLPPISVTTRKFRLASHTPNGNQVVRDNVLREHIV
jgi:hypothetical protein